MRWCTKADFFTQFLRAGSDLTEGDLPDVLGYKGAAAVH
jgi:hypothetical protein